MTRKKSNVKALALAVTCAILAGGYSVSPVYAADLLYKDTSDSTVYANAAASGRAKLTSLSLGNITIDGSNIDNLSINSVGSDGMPAGTISVNGLKIAKNGIATIGAGSSIGGFTFSEDGMTVSGSTVSFAEMKAATDAVKATGNDALVKKSEMTTELAAKASKSDFDALKTTVGDANNGLVKEVADHNEKIIDLRSDTNANETQIRNLQEKTQKISYNSDSDITEVNSKLSAKSLKLSGDGAEGTLTAKHVDKINRMINADDSISSVIYGQNGSGVGGVTFTDGKMSGVTDINNGFVKIQQDSEGNDVGLQVNGELQVDTIKNSFGLNSVKVDDLNKTVNNTQQITYNSDTTTSVNGTKFIANTNGTNRGVITDYLQINDTDGIHTYKLDLDQLKALNSVVGKDNTINAANGSVVGKVKFNDKGVIVNEGEAQQVIIDENGIKVGTGSAYINNDGFKAGADGKNSLTTSGLNATTINAGANNTEFTVDADGNVVSRGSVTADSAGFNNLAVTNGMTVGNTTDFVNMTGGNLVATGNITAMKDVGVGGNLNVTGAAKSKTIAAGTNGNEFTVDENGNIVSKGSLSAADGKFTVDGATGNTTVGGTLSVTGNTTVGGTLGVTGDATFSGNVSVAKNIKGETLNIGATGNEFTVDTLGNITANGITTSDSTTNKIGGVTLSGSDISARNLTLTGMLKADKYDAKDIEATNSIKIGATTLTDGKLDLGSNGVIDFGVNELNDAQVGNINNVIKSGGVVNAADGSVIGGVNFSAKDVTGVKDLTASGKITADEITDGTATLRGGALTGVASATIGTNTTIDSTGVNTNKVVVGSGLNATKIDEANGILSAKGEIGGVKFIGTGKLENVTAIDGVSVAQNSGSVYGGLTFGGNAIIGATGTPFQSTGFSVDNDGDVAGKSFTAGGSSLKDGELKLNDANIWNTSEGIKAEKATIGVNTFDGSGMSTTGTLGVAGKATFGDSTSGNYTTVNGGTIEINANGGKTTIAGDKITTKTLDVEDIILRNEMKDGTGNTITIKGSDGSMSVASGAFAVDKEGQLTNKISGTAGGYTYETNLETSKSGINANYTNGVNGNQNSFTMGQNGISLGVVDSTGNGSGFKADVDSALMGYGTANSISVSADTIKSALGTDVARVMTNGAKKSISDKVGSATRTMTEEEITDEAAGMTVKTNSDGTTFSNGTNTTNINGSKLTSTNGSATGVLDGSNLTLTDGSNSTKLTAGGATFVGAAGESNKAGTKTIIDGGTITTDTLNVERINLGEEMHDAAGTPHGANLSMDKEGNFMAAGSNFTVIGGSGADKGAFTNKVGNTNLSTSTSGASMSYDKTASGGVKSEVSVGDGAANVSAGAGSIGVKNDEIKSAVGSDASSTITSDKIVDKVGNNSVTTDANGTTFDNGSGKTTTINGGTITTGKLVTDELVITGSGEAAGSGTGSIAFGGNGTIKSDIKDGAKNTTFTTDIDGVTTNVTDGTNTTTNEVKATGNKNTVSNGTWESENKQTATSIGGVITNGTVKIAQTLDGENGTITNEVTDKDGNSSKLVQDGTGLTYTDSANDGNATRIDSKDISIGSATDDSKRINLSDLGQIDDIDSELQGRDEYKNNSTAVGGLNAEAAIRREEVARLDNRIDDVNNRVDKVGAMAAAIASLKTMGYDPQAPSEFSVGLGQYKGETGVALGFFHYPNKNFMVNVSLSTAGGETMGGIGATWRFGHKSPQKLLQEQREAQAKKELAAAEKYRAAAQLAKEAQERAEYAAKLARQAQVSADNAKAAADATQAKHFTK